MSKIQKRPKKLTEEQHKVWDLYNIYKVRYNDSTVKYYGIEAYFSDNPDKYIVDMVKELGLSNDILRNQLKVYGYSKQEIYVPQPFEIRVQLPYPLENYYITNNGRVISQSASYNIVRKTKLDRAGYPKVVLKGSDGKIYEKVVHRLVAKYFIPNPSNLPEVNHINGDKLNYNMYNLEWCTREYNMEHYYDVLMKDKKHLPGNIKINQEIADNVKRCISLGMSYDDIIKENPKVTKSIIQNIKFSSHWS